MMLLKKISLEEYILSKKTLQTIQSFLFSYKMRVFVQLTLEPPSGFEHGSGSKVDSVLHSSEVYKMSIRNSGNLEVKSKLPPQSGSPLEAVEPHP